MMPINSTLFQTGALDSINELNLQDIWEEVGQAEMITY